MPYMEQLLKFHLDLRSMRQRNYPLVSCLEESYLLEYNESEVKIFTRGKSVFYLRPGKISAPETSSIPRYSECTKTTSFSILGFLRPGIKLGFEFPGVLPNQKLQLFVSKI